MPIRNITPTAGVSLRNLIELNEAIYNGREFKLFIPLKMKDSDNQGSDYEARNNEEEIDPKVARRKELRADMKSDNC